MASISYIKEENSTYLLQENGDKIFLEDGAVYILYKVTAISIKCGTAITDKLKLRKIQ